MDSVLVNFLELFTGAFTRTFPDKPIPRFTQLTDYDLSKTFNVSWDYIEIVFNQLRHKNLYKSASPMDATFFIFLKKLIEEGHEVFIVTKNPVFIEEQVKYFLGKYGVQNIPIYFVEKMEDKFNYDFDVMIDDSPHYLNHKYWFFNSNKLLLVYDAPWNYQITLKTNNQKRVYNWMQIYEVIREEAKA